MSYRWAGRALWGLAGTCFCVTKLEKISRDWAVLEDIETVTKPNPWGLQAFSWFSRKTKWGEDYIQNKGGSLGRREKTTKWQYTRKKPMNDNIIAINWTIWLKNLKSHKGRHISDFLQYIMYNMWYAKKKKITNLERSKGIWPWLRGKIW